MGAHGHKSENSDFMTYDKDVIQKRILNEKSTCCYSCI